MMTTMFQNQTNPPKFSPEESFRFRNSGLESNPTQNKSFSAAMAPGVQDQVLAHQIDQRKRALLSVVNNHMQVPLEVSITTAPPPEKRRKVSNNVIPRGFGQSIPLKKASWWKTGADLPKTLMKESTPFTTSNGTTAGEQPQSTAFVSFDSLSNCNRTETPAQHDGSRHSSKQNATMVVTTSNNNNPVGMFSSSSTDIASFVRRANAGKQQLQVSETSVQNLDVASHLRSLSSSFGNNSNATMISPILTMLQGQAASHTMRMPQQQQHPSRIINDDASNDAASTSGESGGLNPIDVCSASRELDRKVRRASGVQTTVWSLSRTKQLRS